MEDAWVLCDDEKTKKVDLSMALCDSVERCYLLVYEAVYEKDMKNTRLTKSGNNTNDEDATASTYSSSDLENVVPKLECDWWLTLRCVCVASCLITTPRRRRTAQPWKQALV